MSFETSFDSKQPKLVSALSETKRLFRLFRFYTETESFDVSIEPKQTEDQPKQFFTEKLGFSLFFSVFFRFFVFFLSFSVSPSPVSKLSLFLSLPVCRRSGLLTGDGRRGLVEEPSNMTARKPGPL